MTQKRETLRRLIDYEYDPHVFASPQSDEATIEFEGFTIHTAKQIFYWIFVFLSFGFLWLLTRWIPSLYITLNCSPSSLNKATRICAKGHYKELTIVHNETDHFLVNQGSSKYFIWRYQTWRWYSFVEDLSYCSQYRPISYPFSKPVSEFCAELRVAYAQDHQDDRESLNYIYGLNLISIPLPGPLQLLLDEVLHPFYLFQLFSVVLWYVEVYATYATAIIIISVTGAIIGVIQTRKNLINLKKLAEYECLVELFDITTKTQQTISSKNLVPGDIIAIQEGLVMPCDVILLQGKCVVNESMLTGESVPVIKAPADSDDQDTFTPSQSKHSKYTLYGGTEVLQIKTLDEPEVLGMVFQTGFSTTKGQLVRSILYPKPLNMKFYRDSFYFILFLFCISCIGFLLMIFRFIQLGVSWYEIIIRGLDLYTIAIPPALPIALTIGTVFAVDRLKRKNISCIAPSRVNLAGLVETFCFDKTGTLTEDGLDVKSVRPSTGNPANFITECTHIGSLAAPDLMKVLTSCHSLALLGDSLVGDSLEVKMFEETGWILEEIAHNSEVARNGAKVRVLEPEHKALETQIQIGNHQRLEYGIIKQFDFSSEYQRMSTLCIDMNTQELFLCCKGAPEILGDICNPESLPSDYHDILAGYAGCGFRVLGCSIRKLKGFTLETASQLTRDEAETNLTFVGLLVMQNTLKKETRRALRLLNNANIDSIMVTGDNPLTACYVAVACKLVKKTKKIYLSTIKEGQGIVWQDINDSRSPPVELFQLLFGGNQEYGTTGLNSPSYERMKGLKTSVNEEVELAVTGSAFEILLKSPQEFSTVLEYAHVYARMKPDQKQKLVETLEERGLTVGMCGDGANDCGALKAADVGISLSEAEASIAAPFTSAIPNIHCVQMLLREGRCAMVTSFQAFKYMASYSLIQFGSSMILYAIASLFGDMQFLWIDLFIVMPLAFVSEYTGPYHKLSKKRPVASLVGWNVITSLLIQNCINLFFQVLCFGLLYTQDWFTPLVINPDSDNSQCAEVTTVFVVANFQYIFSVLAFSTGKPYRLPIISNIAYVITLIILVGLNLILLLFPPPFIINWFELVSLPFQFKILLLVLVIINAIIVLLAERVHHYAFITKDICGEQQKFTKKYAKK